MTKYTIFNPSRFQVLDIQYGTKKEMEERIELIKHTHPNEDLVVMEVA